jgi:hypothetical protein
METNSDASVESNVEETAAQAQKKSSRPPPIVLTSAANRIQLQKQLRGVTQENFELRNTRNGTRVVTKDMVDYLAVKAYFDQHSFSYFTFYPKSEKAI